MSGYSGRGRTVGLLAGAVIASLARRKPVPVPKPPDPIDAEHLRARADEAIARGMPRGVQVPPDTGRGEVIRKPEAYQKAVEKRARRAARART